MPVKRQKSSLAARLGDEARRAFDETKSKEPEYDSQAGLPAGIEGGVARLVQCRFVQIAEGKQNAGKDMFFAAGIVLSPAEVNGVNIAGLRTQISEPLYPTPTRSRKTVAEHVEWVLNEMKKLLGGSLEDYDVDDLETLTAGLEDGKPTFRFRTWSGTKQEPAQKGGKWFLGNRGPYASLDALKGANPYWDSDPMVNHVWNGVCEYEGDDAGPVTSGVTETEPAEGDVFEAEEVAITDDLSELAAAADGGDEKASIKLANIAQENGVTVEQIDSVETWTEVVSMIEGGGEEEEEEEEEEAQPPKKGDVYLYKGPGVKKARDCEVTAVFAGKELVNLKDLTTEKVYKSVPWSKLE